MFIGELNYGIFNTEYQGVSRQANISYGYWGSFVVAKERNCLCLQNVDV